MVLLRKKGCRASLRAVPAAQAQTLGLLSCLPARHSPALHTSMGGPEPALGSGPSRTGSGGNAKVAAPPRAPTVAALESNGRGSGGMLPLLVMARSVVGESGGLQSQRRGGVSGSLAHHRRPACRRSA
jgi:hypothetical protein